MRILLTGSQGMVGKNVLEHEDAVRHEWLVPGSDRLDLRDAEATRSYLKREMPELVIHAAGRVGGIQKNLSHPVSFLVENLDIGRNLLLAIAEHESIRCLNLGSSCMYPRGLDRAIREEDLLTGEMEPTNEAYALAKNVVARLGLYLDREHGSTRFRTLIPCNLYGRWDHFEPERSHMVPAVIYKIHKALRSGSDEVVIWGDGMARREFLYAGDLADCLLRAVDRFDSLPPLMNVGLGHDFTIIDYYKAIASALGWSGSFRHDLDRPVGMKRKLVDTQLQESWGWKARTSLEDGLGQTVEFYLKREATGQ